MSNLDLIIERKLSVPRALVWKAWADPRHLEKWWAPEPWRTEVSEYEFQTGGAFHSVMRGPNGEAFGGVSAFLEVIEQERIAFTTALGAEWRPAAAPGMPFTAVFTLSDDAAGCTYTARVLHGNAEDKQRHIEMGFEQGWGAVITQLENVAKTLQN